MAQSRDLTSLDLKLSPILIQGRSRTLSSEFPNPGNKDSKVDSQILDIPRRLSPDSMPLMSSFSSTCFSFSLCSQDQLPMQMMMLRWCRVVGRGLVKFLLPIQCNGYEGTTNLQAFNGYKRPHKDIQMVGQPWMKILSSYFKPSLEYSMTSH